LSYNRVVFRLDFGRPNHFNQPQSLRNRAYPQDTMKIYTLKSCTTGGQQRRAGFTLLQILIVISIIGILAAISVGLFTRGRATARRAQCDVHLKAIALALDTFRQENGRLPVKLSELLDKKYVSLDVLRCPSDPSLDTKSNDPTYISYGDFYIIREPRDSAQLPILVCPLHNADGRQGVQAYKGQYTTQFVTQPATLAVNDFSGAVTITRPGQGVLALPVNLNDPLVLRGGDRIKTGSGTATIRFSDGTATTAPSAASVQPNTEISVLESYIEGQRSGPLYTLIRQFSGRTNYYVRPGSHFDVATPTATAGALGTKFTIDVLPTSNAGQSTSNTTLDTYLTVTEHVVALTTTEQTVNINKNDSTVRANDPLLKKLKKRIPRTIGALLDLLNPSTEIGHDD
jgi:type II secretory pathway pseudopilin PulG